MIVAINQLHPATKILIWLCFAIAIQGLGVVPLTLLSVATAVLLLAGHRSGALLMVHRARWLLLSLFVIYAFATPGDALFSVQGGFSPTFQGVLGGAMQAWRLLLLLLALGLLLRSCSKYSLLAGFYVLMRPFRNVGVDPDRVAVRLWLTLQYAEQQQPGRNLQARWDELQSALDPVPGDTSAIRLELPAFASRDAFVLVLAVFFLGWALW